MLENSLFYINAEPELKIWRYVSLFKLKDLLVNEALYLSQADVFDDPFEGSIPKREAHHRQQILESHETFSKFSENYKRQVYVNCWHINEFESDAMWKLYLKDWEGVAIQSSVNRLTKTVKMIPPESYPDHIEQEYRRIGISKVRYIDYNEDIFHSDTEYPVSNINTVTPYVHKRKEFSHEKELRLILLDHSGSILDTENNPRGLSVGIDVESLIDAIILPPKCSEELRTSVDEIIKKAKIDLQPRNSRMSQQAEF